MRDVYLGTDPFITELIHVLHNVTQERDALRIELNAIKTPYKKNTLTNISEWTGNEFLNEFERYYYNTFKSKIDITHSKRYLKGKITLFIKHNKVDKVLYKAYIHYLFTDDPYFIAGNIPDITWLYHQKMYNLFLNRYRRGKVKQRNTNGTFKSTSYSKKVEAMILDID